MKILITAGPTYEKIDPVRFIGNYSSGKMGFALANAAANLGHEVILVAGPVQLLIEHTNIKRIDVESAAEMYDAVMEQFPAVDVTICCAAVADYTPKFVMEEKKKRKEGEGLTIELVPTKDIAAALGKIKQPTQKLVGFALESHNELENALSKLKRKNFDFIVLNSLQDANACFGYDTNKITILFKDGDSKSYPLLDKSEVAVKIIQEIL